jgi:predicted lipoprotein with Yx(FWY)xxD motif
MKLAALAALAAAVLVPTAAAGMHHEVAPVKAKQTAKFGAVVATTKGVALYTWNREKDGKVRCTGACAKMWPPLLVMKDDMVVKHVKGVMGTLGTVRRPDGHVQVTLNHRPLYTYAGDTPAKILRNGVDGWFVVRA